MSDREQNAALQKWILVWIRAVNAAWESEEAKQKLIENPRAALLESFGYDVPPGVTLTVAEVDTPGMQWTQLKDFKPEAFVVGSPVRMQLTVPLLHPPTDLAEGLLQLASHDGISDHYDCVCVCV